MAQSFKPTATDVTVEHYQRPEVLDVILRYCSGPRNSFRALNGGDSWYKPGSGVGQVQLTTPDDYNLVINRHRTMYATIDFLDESVKKISEKWDRTKSAPEKPIGTMRDCRAFTLSVDIDSIKGSNGENIVTSPEIKAAVEAACQFFVDYLRDRGVSKSVHCLYSGGGAYVHIHHSLFQAKDDWTPEDCEYGFRSLTMAYNALIAEIEMEFFKAHPEHKGRVKLDKLNNQKRKFKCIFSVHKKLPFAVVPLNPGHIEIDFAKATLPLSDDVLAEGARWYQEYDINEKEALKKILAPLVEVAEEELKERHAIIVNRDIPRFSKPIPIDRWAPCMVNIVKTVTPDRAPHRALAVLASYLYTAGYDEDRAFDLWVSVADQVGVEPRIFDVWYGQMSLPNCRTIQRKSDGYPRIGLGGLGYCPGRCM